MTRVLLCVALSVFAFTGCTSPPPRSAEVAQRNLRATMTDEEMLRALGHDPNAMKSEHTKGKGGTSATYANDRTEITITRSIVSGVGITQWRPQFRQWKVGK